MAFSISFGLPCMCFIMLLFLPGQGQHQWNTTSKPPKRGFIPPPCCPTISKARITEHVRACYEQKEDTFPDCRVHAYIFITVSDEQRCVDPSASWLQKRLQMLKSRGITCVIL